MAFRFTPIPYEDVEKSIVRYTQFVTRVKCICQAVVDVDGMAYCPSCRATLVIYNEQDVPNLAVIVPELPEGVDSIPVPVFVDWIDRGEDNCYVSHEEWLKALKAQEDKDA